MEKIIDISQFEAIIFDMDGVLIDSEPLWKIAMEEVFQNLGSNLTKKDFEKTVGLRIDEVIKFWNKEESWGVSDLVSVERSIVERMVELIELHPDPLPGVVDTLQQLKKMKIKIGLATSSSTQLIKAVLKNLEIEHYFDVTHSAEYEDFGKPHPAVYIYVANKLGISPQKCLVVEDSYNGVIAGLAAKMKVVCIPEKTHEVNPKLKLADFFYDNMNSFKNSLK